VKTVHFVSEPPVYEQEVVDYFLRYGIRAIPILLDKPAVVSDTLKKNMAERLRFTYGCGYYPLVEASSGIIVPAVDKTDIFWNFVLGLRGIDGILSEIRCLLGEQRRCERRFYLAYYNGMDNEPIFFEHTISGYLATEPRGRETSSLGIDRIFIPDGSSRTLCEMSRIRHRRFYKRLIYKHSPIVQFARWYNQE
jgi:inosine/xanthosine triphosphate pyrophosphatase family protein